MKLLEYKVIVSCKTYTENAFRHEIRDNVDICRIK